MSGLLRFFLYLVIFVAALGALTIGMCVALQPSYPKITAVQLSLVPLEQVPPGSSFGRIESSALRIDFRARPPLPVSRFGPRLAVRFCGDRENPWWEIWSGQIYVGDKRLSEALTDPTATYSGYLPISHTPVMPDVPAVGDEPYDLRQQALPLCAWVDYGTTAFKTARTNVIRFEADAVAAALR